MTNTYQILEILKTEGGLGVSNTLYMFSEGRNDSNCQVLIALA